MLEIIKKYFGFTTKEAKKYMQNANIKTLQEIKKSFENNAKISFWED